MKKVKFEIESLWTLTGLAIGVVAIGCLLWLAIVQVYPRLSDRADFGNLFGGINALFAALAFAALTFTLILQQRALAIQRAQLIEQQRELTNQNLRLEQQSFETMLVQLLGFHHEIAKDIHVRLSGADFQGRQALCYLADELIVEIKRCASTMPNVPSIEIAQTAFERFHARFRGVLDHYSRNLYPAVLVVSGRVPAIRRQSSCEVLGARDLVLKKKSKLARQTPRTGCS